MKTTIIINISLCAIEDVWFKLENVYVILTVYSFGIKRFLHIPRSIIGSHVCGSLTFLSWKLFHRKTVACLFHSVSFRIAYPKVSFKHSIVSVLHPVIPWHRIKKFSICSVNVCLFDIDNQQRGAIYALYLSWVNA